MERLENGPFESKVDGIAKMDCLGPNRTLTCIKIDGQYGRLFVKVNGPKDETRTDQYILEISSSLRSGLLYLFGTRNTVMLTLDHRCRLHHNSFRK